MTIDFIGFAYAATVASGGILGYVKAKSIPSLGAGLTFGLILGYGAVLTSQSPPEPALQLGTSLVLAGVMGNRFRRTGKLMPAGLIAGLSAAAFVRGLYEFNAYLPLVGRSRT